MSCLMFDDEAVAGLMPEVEYEQNVNCSTLSGADVRYTRYGKIVTLIVNTASASLTANAWNQVGQLPESARPSYGFYDLITNNAKDTSSTIPAQISITGAGVIRIWPFYTGQHIGMYTFVI